jgi:hypothetical protein
MRKYGILLNECGCVQLSAQTVQREFAIIYNYFNQSQIAVSVQLGCYFWIEWKSSKWSKNSIALLFWQTDTHYASLHNFIAFIYIA